MTTPTVQLEELSCNLLQIHGTDVPFADGRAVGLDPASAPKRDASERY